MLHHVTKKSLKIRWKYSGAKTVKDYVEGLKFTDSLPLPDKAPNGPFFGSYTRTVI
jgi:hypothetical protein